MFVFILLITLVGVSAADVSTCDDLNNIRNDVTATYTLTSNINFDTDGGNCSNYTTGTGWVAIPDFNGTLNGGNKTITGLYINRSAGGTYSQ